MSIENYIRNLAIADFDLYQDTENRRRTRRDAPQTELPADLKAAVGAGSLISFVDGVEAAEREDILFSVQYAQRAASAAFDRFAESRSWYAKYIEVLEVLGWAGEQFAFAEYRQDEGELQMDKAALAIITAVATQNQLAVITQSIKALEQLGDDGKLGLGRDRRDDRERAADALAATIIEKLEGSSQPDVNQLRLPL